jgi:hypothetical protein
LWWWKDDEQMTIAQAVGFDHAAIITALAGLVTAGSVAYTRIMAEQRRNRKALDKVHVLVNSSRVAMEARIAQLTAALTKAGIEVPPAPSPIHSTPPTKEQLDL